MRQSFSRLHTKILLRTSREFHWRLGYFHFYSQFAGQNATISCRVDSVPRARIRWFRHEPVGGGGRLGGHSFASSGVDVTIDDGVGVYEAGGGEADAVVVNNHAVSAGNSNPAITSSEILNNSVSMGGERRFLILESGGPGRDERTSR